VHWHWELIAGVGSESGEGAIARGM
jgi:hypothetical protein